MFWVVMQFPYEDIRLMPVLEDAKHTIKRKPKILRQDNALTLFRSLG